jgi:hypothetical protein
MLEVRNRTPFAAGLMPGLDTAGVEHAIVVVKGTFAVRPSEPISVADEQTPIAWADVFHGEPGKSSIRYASDGALHKPGTDVYVVGSAHAPKHGVPFVDVGLRVGSAITKPIRVFGDRRWERRLGSWTATLPAPFDTVPLLWERAFGGAAVPRNPVGTGAAAVEGMPLPNLEDLRAPIRSPRDQPVPMGLGAVAPHWTSRAQWAGTLDDRWQKERCPLLPLDFDERFVQVAPPDQIVTGYLRGGEPVRLIGCTREGTLDLTVPTRRLRASALVRGVETTLDAVLDTLLVEPDLQRIMLTWRATVPCGRNFLRVAWVKVEESA